LAEQCSAALKAALLAASGLALFARPRHCPEKSRRRLSDSNFAFAATLGVTQKPTPLKFRGLSAIVTKFFFYESVR
jgi:hypothetical protein